MFLPFHYGPWRSIRDTSQDAIYRAANELTIGVWDPVSKQPLFKAGAVHIDKIETGDGSTSSAPTVGAPRPADGTTVTPTTGGTAALASSIMDDERS